MIAVAPRTSTQPAVGFSMGHEITLSVDTMRQLGISGRVAEMLNESVGKENWFKSWHSGSTYYRVVLRTDADLLIAVMKFPYAAFSFCYNSGTALSTPHLFDRHTFAYRRIRCVQFRMHVGDGLHRGDELRSDGPYQLHRVWFGVNVTAVPPTLTGWHRVRECNDGAWFVGTCDRDALARMASEPTRFSDVRIKPRRVWMP